MLRIAGIINESIVDGEGCRLVVFTQGCSHGCPGCQNQDTHDFNGGRTESIENIIKLVCENPLLDGITLSGGDPFFQAGKLIELAKSVKDRGLSVWAYTGFTFEDFLAFRNKNKCDSRITSDMIDLLEYVDVLVDGPFILELRTLNEKFRGSKNQRIIDVKKSFEANNVVLYTPED